MTDASGAPPQDPTPYRIRDPRLQRIHERLCRLVGPGPADHFRDACRVMEEPSTFLSTTNLVSHLLREIEDALRDVLTPIAPAHATGRESRRVHLEKIFTAHGLDPLGSLARAFEPLVEVSNPRSLRPTHKAQVRAILSALFIKEDSDIARAWLRFAGGDYSLHRFAHRRNFDAPRPVDVAFTSLWNDMVGVLDATLARLEEQYDSVFTALSVLRALPSPSADDALSLVSKAPNNAVARRYFFEGLENPAWVAPLTKKGVFRSPPPPIVKDVEPNRKSISYYWWPESRYLARMARKPEAQADVARALADMQETDNVRVIGDVLEAIAALPIELGRDRLERALAWVERQEHLLLLLPEQLQRVAEHLSTNGERALAERVLRALLLPTFPGAGEYGEPRARIESWDYRRVLTETLPRLRGTLTERERFEFLLDLLERAQTPGGERQIPSHFWRSSIEDSAQNHRDDVGAALITGIRDAAHAVATENPASLPAILDRLEGGEPQGSIKRRLALNLLRTSLVADVPRIAAALLDRKLLLDLDVHHEYRVLLRDRFGALSEETQGQLLTLFESAPYVERLKAENAANGEPLSPEKELEYRERSVREMFSLIEPHLTGERLTHYRAIVNEYGHSPHPEYLIYSEGGFVGSQSPRSAEELRPLSVPQLRDFLDTWLPPDDPFHGPSRDGLASALTALVGSAAARYGPELENLRCVEPTYVRGILAGFTNAVKAGSTIPWAPLLAYCSWVVAHAGDAPSAGSETWGRDRGWGWARSAVLDLLEAGFREGGSRIPSEHREAAWAVLEPLTRDPSSPTAETEATSTDMVTTAINSVRGRALERVIEYAFWVRETSAGTAEVTFEQMPEVRQALQSRLDPRVERSAAVRAVYGLHLVRLFIIDRAWVASVNGLIFPADSSSAELRRAAWSAYLSFNRPYDDVFAAISGVYESAIGRMEAGDSADGATWPKLGEHLAILYWRGKITIDRTSLLQRFFSAAPDDVRAHVIDVIGRAIKNQEQVLPAPVRARLEALWVDRLDSIRSSGIPAGAELRAFSWWFASKAFAAAWASRRLIEGSELRGGLPADHWILETLGDLAAEIPLEALRLLREMTLGELDPMHFSLESNRVRQIIFAGRAAPCAETDALIREVLGRIAAKGCTDFLDLSSDRPS